MYKEDSLNLELKQMIKDGILSILCIVGGHSLKVKMDSIINAIHATNAPIKTIFGIPLDFYLKITSLIAMWVGIVVGVITIYSFIKDRINYYKGRNRNK